MHTVVIAVVWLVVWFAVSAVCWTYSLNEWLMFLKKDVTVQWWQGGLIGFVPFLGQASIPVAVITWFLMLVLV